MEVGDYFIEISLLIECYSGLDASVGPFIIIPEDYVTINLVSPDKFRIPSSVDGTRTSAYHWSLISSGLLPNMRTYIYTLDVYVYTSLLARGAKRRTVGHGDAMR